MDISKVRCFLDPLSVTSPATTFDKLIIIMYKVKGRKAYSLLSSSSALHLVNKIANAIAKGTIDFL